MFCSIRMFIYLGVTLTFLLFNYISEYVNSHASLIQSLWMPTSELPYLSLIGSHKTNGFHVLRVNKAILILAFRSIKD